ncbi:MAG: T9SS type A sorting domain-containing protein [Chitinophagales bacterium]|nr:T9SS type A sorting domain-containing protein [Chitinophagales bacterium]
MNPSKLKSYSLAAASFLFLKSNLKAEIVYVDIEPDIILDSDTDINLDIDMDGSSDFLFVMNSGFRAVFGGFYDSYTFSSLASSFISMRAGGIGGNEMVAESVTSTSKGTIYHFYGVAPLYSGDMINYETQFNEDGSMNHVALKQRQVTAPSYYPLSDWFYPGMINPWNYNVLQGEDRYAGIRFTDNDNCLHYGWIRCAVADSNEQYILKDYAYETFCDWAIYAADTAGGHPPLNVSDQPFANIYSTNSSVFIELPQIRNNASVQISDLNGREIYSALIKEQQTIIEIKTLGVYLITIKNGDEIFAKKVFIN